MKNLSIPVGVSDFEEIRRKGYYYVDKSMLIAKLLKDNAYSVRTAHPFRRNGAPFRFKLSKAQQVD